jgi:ribosomal protein S18 acetylase RimI-like enzyme
MDIAAVQISLVSRAEVTPAQVAEFGTYAAACNTDSHQHIGYLGTEPDDVTAELRELEGDHVYAAAREGTRLCGLLCAEWDLDLGRTWLYGPWAETPELMDRLYGAVRPLVPAGASLHELFCEIANTAVCDFAERHGFGLHGDHVIMRLARERLSDLEPVRLPPLTQRWHEQVATLHDSAFPNTYAPSGVLLSRDQPMYRSFVAADGDTLLGYVVLKLRPEYGEALIEYVAVTEAARGRGVGTRLVTAALHEAFTDERLDAMDLVTNNPAARRVYEKVGFTLLREMRSFRTP